MRRALAIVALACMILGASLSLAALDSGERTCRVAGRALVCHR